MGGAGAESTDGGLEENGVAESMCTKEESTFWPELDDSTGWACGLMRRGGGGGLCEYWLYEF